MSRALEEMLSQAHVPTPTIAAPNPRIFDNLKGDVANGRTFRDARALDEANAAASDQSVDPEQAYVSDLDDAKRIVAEEMAKILPPPEVRARWEKAVEDKTFRTWVQPKHKACRFPVHHIIGGGQPGEKDPAVTVATFRKIIQAAVVGTAGGSLLYTVRNQQYNGAWEAYDYFCWDGLMGGGTIMDVKDGRLLGTTSPTRQLFLAVQFVDVSGNQPVVYDAKGIPNTDFAKGGAITEQMVDLLKQMKAREDREIAASQTDAAKENAELRAQLEALSKKVEALLGATPSGGTPEEREHHKTREARLRREAEAAALAANKPTP